MKLQGPNIITGLYDQLAGTVLNTNEKNNVL